MWLLISRRTLGEISVTIRGHPHALPILPASSKRRFLLRSDDNFGESHPDGQPLICTPGAGRPLNCKLSIFSASDRSPYLNCWVAWWT